VVLAVVALLAFVPAHAAAAPGAHHGPGSTTGKSGSTSGKKSKPPVPTLLPAKSRVRVIVTSANLNQALTPENRVPFTSIDPNSPPPTGKKHQPAPTPVPVIQVSEGTRFQRMKGVGAG
jgi:hypothetical protein